MRLLLTVHYIAPSLICISCKLERRHDHDLPGPVTARLGRESNE